MVHNSEIIRKTNMRQINIIILFTISFITFHLCIEKSFVEIYTFIYYFLYVIVLVMECEYLQLLSGIQRRFAHLTECLKHETEIANNTSKIKFNTNEISFLRFLNENKVSNNMKLSGKFLEENKCTPTNKLRINVVAGIIN